MSIINWWALVRKPSALLKNSIKLSAVWFVTTHFQSISKIPDQSLKKKKNRISHPIGDIPTEEHRLIQTVELQSGLEYLDQTC